ncbi:MAG: hypothetical protein RLY93_10445 [Sumerlaeia bacterium]
MKTLPHLILCAIACLFLFATSHAANSITFTLQDPVPCGAGQEFRVGIAVSANDFLANNIGVSFDFSTVDFEFRRHEVAPEFAAQSDSMVFDVSADSDGFLEASFNREIDSLTPKAIEPGPIMSLVFRTNKDNIQGAKLVEPGNFATFIRAFTENAPGTYINDAGINVTCQGGTTDPTLVYRALFDNGDTDNWIATQGPLGPFDGPVSGTTSDGITLTPAGSVFCFGFWSSPPIDVPAGELLEVNWRFRTNGYLNDDPFAAPQFRPRINEGQFRQAATLPIESVGTPSISPPADGRPATYHLIWEQPADANQLFLSFDILNFDSSDDANAVIELLDVEVRRLDIE